MSAINLSDEDWSNIVNISEYKRAEKLPNKTKIRIGRHSRDHEVKWPNNKQELLSIYPDSDKFEVYILGGGINPIRVAGYKPKNWKIYQFGEVSPKDFLAELDVFVYYTHPDWVESFGRVIIEAMAAGVPVVLPPIYKELFQEAAIFAEPKDVLMTIDQLVSDEDYYRSRVKKANEYVESNFGYSMHLSRISKFLQKENT
ncbi:MAG: glycosyltransferase [Bacillus sp. (in: Bacteria)]|nr:glycosyltransferase [Bacillus sp. (in: firmicutes)]